MPTPIGHYRYAMIYGFGVIDTPDADAFIFGHFLAATGVTADSVIPAQNSYISVDPAPTGTQNCYIEGGAQARNSYTFIVAGQSQNTVVPRHQYPLTVTTSPLNVAPGEALGGIMRVTISPSSKTGYVFGMPIKANFISPQSLVRGYIVTQDLFTSTASQFSHIVCPDWYGIADLTRPYVAGKEVVIDSQPAFIEGVNPSSAIQNAYISSEAGTLVSSKSVYINGSSSQIFSFAQFAYVKALTVYNNTTSDWGNLYPPGNGGLYANHYYRLALYINNAPVVLTSSKSCYIYSPGIIGDWKFDDGEIDPTDTRPDDYSSVDNDGYTINLPTWVDGPQC
jgi:hypothetical protein